MKSLTYLDFVFLCQGVFKLSTKSGRQYLLRAPTDEERDVWTPAIGAVIRQLEGMAQVIV